MKLILFSRSLLLIAVFGLSAVQAQDSVVVKKIADEIFANGRCYTDLEYLCKKIGSRLSASEGAEKAVKWTADLMRTYGFDTVYLQKVMVPHWERGAKESALVQGRSGIEKKVNVVALGGSIPTPSGGLKGDVIEVKDFEQLKSFGEEKIKGKIVFFNYPFDVKKIIPFDMYGSAARYRTSGAAEAARYGAIASVTRSMTNYITERPNTGAMHYNDSLPKIPACAISTSDADWLSGILHKDGRAEMRLEMNCSTKDDAVSYNVIGELHGSEKPDEIIVVGGHLDSWDLAEGAHDDGTGCMQSIEVLRTMKAIGIKPKRTIRAVMFMNEENGLKGGIEYANQAALLKENHILALESDAGGFTPRGFTMSMDEKKKERIQKWKDYFVPYGAYDFYKKGGGADISPLGKQGVPTMGFSPDNQRYFVIHHTEKDVFEEVNERELKLGAIVMTMMVYFVSEYGL